MATTTIHTPTELTTLAEEVISILPQKNNAHVIALAGTLGAGKTTFVQALAERLGVVEYVTSPTFVIMKRYEVEHEWIRQLVHIDAYRVDDVAEMEVLHVDELLKAPGAVVCIEWPERIAELLPKDRLDMSFMVGEGDARTVEYNYSR
ncbi:MAG: tRNA (adenosine(37)-N6)-threonylcarbamoyltransferase complex ATPase subunit type 1 TsaE [Candidatus Pacebacteria bacterium]|nr:tRNA (adenosine(37)-N6)-threonylcarbamoyltransferase complex ATPase subunit type 1 TsaE [Candidatus Paceibacterota bacterium]